MAHFFYIHFGLPTYFKNVFEGHIASRSTCTTSAAPTSTTWAPPTVRRTSTRRPRTSGPSFMINWLHNNYGGFKVESILINCHYPVSQNSFVLQWGVIVEKPKGLDETDHREAGRVFTEGVSKGFLQDVEIWKHKTRIDNPLLVEEDGAVYQMRRWYQQFYVDVADVTPDMTDRFEIEVDTTDANEKWHVEVEENLKRAGRRRPAEAEPRAGLRHDRARRADAAARRRPAGPVDAAPARRPRRRRPSGRPGGERRILVEGTGFRVGPGPGRRGARGHAARPGALPQLRAGAGRLPVLSRHRSPSRSSAPEHTAVQWNSEASQRCASFAEVRESGGEPAPRRSCPRLGDSIKHAVAEGGLEAVSSAPSPGDG